MSRKAQENWDRENLQNVTISVRKGIKEQWQLWARESDLSMAAYLRLAAREKAQRDRLSMPAKSED